MTNRFTKLKIALTHYLVGAKMNNALKAMGWAEQYYPGMRKDGVTPVFQHPIEIALFITTLKNIQDEEMCIIVAMMHDVFEDNDIDFDELYKLFDHETAHRVISATQKVTKVYRGNKKNEDDLFSAMATCSIASIVKGCDRIHNQQTMVGPFTKEKRTEYIAETTNYILPMIKSAQKKFPEQHSGYEAIKHMLKSQIALVSEIQ